MSKLPKECEYCGEIYPNCGCEDEDPGYLYDSLKQLVRKYGAKTVTEVVSLLEEEARDE